MPLYFIFFRIDFFRINFRISARIFFCALQDLKYVTKKSVERFQLSPCRWLHMYFGWLVNISSYLTFKSSRGLIDYYYFFLFPPNCFPLPLPFLFPFPFLFPRPRRRHWFSLWRNKAEWMMLQQEQIRFTYSSMSFTRHQGCTYLINSVFTGSRYQETSKHNVSKECTTVHISLKFGL